MFTTTAGSLAAGVICVAGVPAVSDEGVDLVQLATTITAKQTNMGRILDRRVQQLQRFRLSSKGLQRQPKELLRVPKTNPLHHSAHHREIVGYQAGFHLAPQ